MERSQKLHPRNRWNPYQRPNLSKCFRCGQTGHLPNSCPQRRIVALLNQGEESNNDQKDVLEQEEEILEPYDGQRPSCVLQRVLIAPRGDTSHQQRHSLFKTRCIIHNKVCNVIIDSGSSENFVAKKLLLHLTSKRNVIQSLIKLTGQRREEIHN